MRCIGVHGALVLRSEEHFKSPLARPGKGMVHLQRPVLVFKQRWLAKNAKNRKKVRLAVCDMEVKGKVEKTYAPTVGYDSTRFLIQLGVLRGSRRTTKDVGGTSSARQPPPRRKGGAATSSRSRRASATSATRRRTNGAARTTSRWPAICPAARTRGASGAGATTSFP